MRGAGVGGAVWATRGRAVTVAPGRGGGAPSARTARACLCCHREGGDASCCLTPQGAEGMRALLDQRTWPPQSAPHRLGGRRGPGARDGSGPETSPRGHGRALQGALLGADPSCRAGRPLTRRWQPAAPCVPPARPPRGPGRRGRQEVWHRACRRRHGGWASRGFPGACRRVSCRVLGPPCLGVVPSRPQGLTLGVRRWQ